MCDHQEFSRRGFLRRSVGGTLLVWSGGALVLPLRSGTTALASQDSAPADPALWECLADIALRVIRAAGVDYGDIRILHSRQQSISGQDGRIDAVRDGMDRGFGMRVLHQGGWGFAASSVLTEAEVERVAQLAIEVARGSATLVHNPVRLAPEPPHQDSVRTELKRDPFAVPLEQRSGLLLDAMRRMHAVTDIQRSRASLWAQRDQKLFASTDGSRIHFDLLASHGGIRATAVHDGRFDSRGYETPYFRAGYELIEEADLAGNAERVAREAVEKVKSPIVNPGRYDLLLDPAHLSLTIHESCGHPTELDRALGYEANYAGTSFLTPDKLGKFLYGSKHVSLVADNTEAGGLASTGYDDDGVAAQRWDVIRDGVFVGYSSSREMAPKIGLARSAGSCRADNWDSIPIVRIANLGLEPRDGKLDDMLADIRRGIYIEGHGSFSIDQQRYNFQFGGDAFWMIENGKKTHMLRDVIYRGITPEFWGSCDAVAEASHRRRFGFITCGKGQPGQSGWMTHAAAHARFRQVEVVRGGSAG